MSSRPSQTVVVAVVALVACLSSFSCTTRGSKSDTTAVKTAPAPGDPDCYKTAGAVACPPDSTDPSGKNLPTPGGLCKLATCAVCGSATTPAFRDATGVAQPGWCICVLKSDDSGPSIYSCFTPETWPR